MHTVTLEIGQSIKIGEGVWVSLLRIEGLKARLGIAAPEHMPIDREEVARRKAEEGTDGTLLLRPAAGAAGRVGLRLAGGADGHSGESARSETKGG